jgi:hypothetical protein
MAGQSRALAPDPAGPAIAALAAVSAVATIGASDAEAAGTAGTAEATGTPGPAGTPQPPGVAAGATSSAAFTEAAGGANRARPARSAVAAVPEQKRAAASSAGIARRTRPAVAAITEQPPAGPTGVPCSGRPISTVAEQRAPRQIQDRRKRRHVRRLTGRIRATGPGQGLHELLMKRRRLRAQSVKLLALGGKQRRDRRRHFIPGRSSQPRWS